MFSHSCAPSKEQGFIVKSVHWLFFVVQSLGPLLLPTRKAGSLHLSPLPCGLFQEWGTWVSGAGMVWRSDHRGMQEGKSESSV